MSQPRETPTAAADPHDETTGRLVARMSQDLSDLVRSEMALAKADLRQSVRHAGVGAGLFGTAGVLALYGVGALVAAAVLGLALVVDAWLAAVLVALVLLVVAGVVALVGKRQVGEAAPPVRHSTDSVRADVEAVRHPHTSRPRAETSTVEGGTR